MQKKERSLRFYMSPLLLGMVAVGIACGYAVETVSYLVAVCMHELCHAAYAGKKGYTLNAFRLMPYGASLTGEFEGASARDEIKIALVGPLSNAVAATATVALWWIFPSSYFYTDIFAAANVFTAFINLMPVFPLDGGRALLAAFSLRFPRAKVYRIMRWTGFAFSAALCAVAFIARANFSFPTLAAFILFSTVFPDKKCKYERLYALAYRREKIKTGLPVKEIMVFSDATVHRLLSMLSGGCFTRFTVVDERLGVVGTLTETELEQIAAKYGQNISVFDAKFLKKS